MMTKYHLQFTFYANTEKMSASKFISEVANVLEVSV